MKVLRVISGLYTGGAERSLETNVPIHIRNRYEMDVLTLSYEKTPFYNSLINQGVLVIDSYHVSCYNPIHIIKIANLLKHYDVIHGHLFPVFYWLALAKVLSFNRKTKLVFTEHSTSNRRMERWYLKPIDVFMYRRYDKIISISDATTDSLCRFVSDKNKLVTIPNGVLLEPYRREYYKLKFSKDTNSFVLLQIAGFRHEKDQDTVIKALSLLPKNVILLFAGEGPRMSICQDLVKKFNLGSQVFFLGRREDVPQLVYSSDVVIMSSHYEGFGRAAVEGMAGGKPVIATDVPGLRDVVVDAGILFKVGDSYALAKEIKKLMNDHSHYNRVAKICIERSNLYSVESMIHGYEDVYRSLT